MSEERSPERIFSRLKVAVRIRDFNKQEKTNLLRLKENENGQASECIEVDGNNIIVRDVCSIYVSRSPVNVFSFDYVFTPGFSNNEVYDAAVSPLTASVICGYNATCFAYGMTGAGKTYTALGRPEHGIRGMCELAVTDILSHGVISAAVSIVEIYNEAVADILAPGSAKRVVIREDVRGVVTLPGLTSRPVGCADDMAAALAIADSRRTRAATASNMVSSRSHAVVMIDITAPSGATAVRSARLSIIDLAGSERVAVDVPRDDARRAEGANINRSLLALVHCVSLLAEMPRRGDGADTHVAQHVPFRNSKLTRLLKPALLGGARTLMLACVSPSPTSYDETLATLKYAARAMCITTRVARNAAARAPLPSSTLDALDGLREQVAALARDAEQHAASVELLRYPLAAARVETFNTRQCALPWDDSWRLNRCRSAEPDAGRENIAVHIAALARTALDADAAARSAENNTAAWIRAEAHAHASVTTLLTTARAAAAVRRSAQL